MYLRMTTINIDQALNAVVGVKRMQNPTHVVGDRSLDSMSYHLNVKYWPFNYE